MNDREQARTVLGPLSGRTFLLPATDRVPMPLLAGTGVIHDGKPAPGFGVIDGARGYPDVRSYRRKLGLLIPATNTSMEHELWTVIAGNRALDGVGLHTVNVVTPRPVFGDAEQLGQYRQDFLAGVRAAVSQAMLAEPDYLIMGMSLEHILHGLAPIRAAMSEIEALAPIGWAAWQDAAAAALRCFGAKRIGLLTPFEQTGNENAARMFSDLGFDVVSTFGFCCAHALHIAHLPDWAKEKAIVECLATPGNRLDAVVQCGTNMSLLQVTERLEPMLDLPIIGINAALLWYALRENGITAKVPGAGRLFREG
jgi:maleate isomerase